MAIAAYYRVSTKPQSLELQYEAAGRALEGVPAESIEKYEDHGVSAIKKSMKERPDLQRLIRDITGKRVTRVVVYCRDRIAREQFEWIRFWRICNDHNVTIEFTMPGHPSVSDNIVIEMLHAYMSYEEGRKITERGQAGTYLSPRKLIGYITDTANGSKTYLVDPAYADLIKECFLAASACTTNTELITVIEQYRRQLRVTTERVVRILSDDRYMGQVTAQDGSPRFPQIIEPRIFSEVSKAISSLNSHEAQHRTSPLVEPSCGSCHNSMTLKETLFHEDEWVCRNGHRAIRISVSDVDEELQRLTQSLLQSIDRDQVRETCIDEINRVIRKTKRQIRNLEYKLDELALSLAVLPQAGRAYKQQLKKYQEVHQSLAEYESDLHELETHFVELTALLDTTARLAADLPLSREVVRQLISLVVDNVQILPDSINCTIVYSDLWNNL